MLLKQTSVPRSIPLSKYSTSLEIQAAVAFSKPVKRRSQSQVRTGTMPFRREFTMRLAFWVESPGHLVTQAGASYPRPSPRLLSSVQVVLSKCDSFWLCARCALPCLRLANTSIASFTDPYFVCSWVAVSTTTTRTWTCPSSLSRSSQFLKSSQNFNPSAIAKSTFAASSSIPPEIKPLIAIQSTSSFNTKALCRKTCKNDLDVLCEAV